MLQAKLQIWPTCVKQFELNILNPKTTLDYFFDLVLRDAREQGHDGDIAPLAFSKGVQQGQGCLYHSSIIIIGNFMVDQDRVETNLLLLFAHPNT